jgi:crotonobetaine/carnitine-CoA ligase
VHLPQHAARLAHPASDEGFLTRFLDLAAATPDRLFARFDDRPVTFGGLDARSAAFAGRLIARGIGCKDRVALMLGNGENALALLLAIARIGAVWVPINTRAVGANLAYVLSHAAPSLIVSERDLAPTVARCGAVAAPVLDLATLAASDSALLPSPCATRSADAPFAIMYTSGTTGRPKGVTVSHRMLRLAGEAVALVSSARDGDVFYLWEPLFHIGGAQMIVLPLLRDVTLCIAERFRARRFWADVKACGATHMHYLGGILQILLAQPPGPLDRAHALRVAWGGGCPREVWQPFAARFGVEIRECYGMTECASITTANIDGPIGSVGRPVAWFDVAVVDAAGTPVAPGARGEIVVRERVAGALTRGYFKDPGATAAAFRDGAFRTGDLGSLDDAGNMYFCGRLSDSVRVRGENVAAAEVESVAAEHPAVEACAMIGVAAEVGEAEIKLFVQLKPGAKTTPRGLSAWLARNLAPYQRPRYIAFVDAFERTPSQRIIRHSLSKRTDDAFDAAGDDAGQSRADPPAGLCPPRGDA